MSPLGLGVRVKLRTGVRVSTPGLGCGVGGDRTNGVGVSAPFSKGGDCVTTLALPPFLTPSRNFRSHRCPAS